MKYHQKAVLQMTRRVGGFFDANATSVGTVSQAPARAELDALRTQLEELGASEGAHRVASRGETRNQRLVRSELREQHMKPITKIARAKLRDVPQLAAFSLPSSFVDVEGLITAAGSMAEAATQYEQVFVTAGLAPDFIQQLRTAADVVKASVDTRSQSRDRAVGMNKAITDVVKQVRDAVHLLDGLVEPKLRGNPQLLTEWRQAKRVTVKPGPARGSTTLGNAASAGRIDATAPVTAVPRPEPQPAA